MSSLALSACGGLPEYPDHKIYDIDLKSKVCGEYELVDKSKGQFKFVRDLPIKECDGYFAMKPKDITRVKAWIFDVKRAFERRQ